MAVKPISLEREFAKNPEISPEDIKVFRDWLMTQPHLPGQLITDLDLMLVYHCCERSLGVSKNVLDLHYTLRTLYIYFKDRVVDRKIEHCLNNVLFALLPETSVNGYRVFYLKLLDADPKNFMLNDTAKTFLMLYDLWQCEEGTCPGVLGVLDLDLAQLGHLTKLEVSSVRNILYFVQECMFIKLKGVHFVNVPYFMDKVMMLIKPFLKKSLMDIIKIHQTGDTSVYNIIPKKLFPKESGGEFLDYKRINEEVLHRLKSNSDFFKEEAKKRVQESLRPGGKGAASENFGIEGSFKKLDID